MASEYRAASLYVMSSRWEGLPMTLLEAQHFGLPSVSTDCPTGPREVLSGGSGRLVRSEDPQALAEGLAELMTNLAERSEMARAATDNARRYRPEGIRREWEALFAELGLQ
jgi:glycosyltransferase involved in cell wall biosynthesis